MNIKEIRDTTGMTQKDFANKFGIPIGTLRRWEYGESTPAPYIVKLIASQLPTCNDNLRVIKTNDGLTYYYDNDTGVLMDQKGVKIEIKEKLDDIKEQNLPMYVHELFESYYEILEKFERDCRLDKEEDILWRNING